MIEPYELLIKEAVGHQVRELRGQKKNAVRDCEIEYHVYQLAAEEAEDTE